jgi:two-component system response regulator QseB
MRLLVVEDDPMIGKALHLGLGGEGFAVDWVQDGIAATNAIANGVYDLVVLDLGLPGRDGMDILRGMRARRDHLPVLIATARDAVRERVEGLNAGADDYLVKPFDLDELVARIRSLLRRHAGSGCAVLAAGDITLDPVRKAVAQDGRPIALSPREFALLEALMQRPEAVLSREKLEESVYAWNEEVGSNAVEVHLHNLRRKLGAGAVANVRGVGWRMGS